MSDIKGPKQPAPGTSNLPGEVVHIEPYCPGSAQIAGDNTTDGHYESDGGTPKFIGGKSPKPAAA